MSSSTEKFTVGCPRCGKRYVLTAAAIGKTATCKCGKSFVVAKPEEDEDDDDGQDYGVSESQGNVHDRGRILHVDGIPGACCNMPRESPIP